MEAWNRRKREAKRKKKWRKKVSMKRWRSKRRGGERDRGKVASQMDQESQRVL
jgi:hypothetical protein